VSTSGAPLRVVQRTIFPIDRDLDVLPLYLDTQQSVAGARAETTEDSGARSALPSTSAAARTVVVESQHPEHLLDRGRFTVPAGTRASLATYFNALPASYWRRYTEVREVLLRVRTTGAGTVVVYRSTAKGHTQRVSAHRVSGTDTSTEVALSLAPFGDGGWYWYDIVADAASDVVLEAGEWAAADLTGRHGTVTVGITTFNRPDYCLRQLITLSGAPELDGVLDQVVIVDQGTDKVRDQPGFDEVAAAMGDRLRIVEQANLGGSGGFARGMLETLEAGRSDYVLLLDDDVISEPAGIARAVTFADLCREPTIVGGHMFSLYERSVLHTTGESVDRWRFAFQPTPVAVNAHDFATGSLRATPQLHRRTDVEYNGWWMCLVPVDVVRRIGLSMPYFIKWDDAEYGLRAGREGIPTVTLPGAAVWHMPFTDKDDTLDWQAYFHLRNRVVAALIYSPYDLGGGLVRESLQHQLKHLVAMQYSVAELRLQALEDVLSGPGHLHPTLGTRLREINELRSQFPDSRLEAERMVFPPARRARPPRRGKQPAAPRGKGALLATAAAGLVRQVRPVEDGAGLAPQADVAAMDARWWRLAQLDSAVVSTADGTKTSWYRRDPRRFRALLLRSVAVHQRLLASWGDLRADYRSAQADLVSPEAWKDTFASTSSTT
jgi:galactofuranosylgalactofuranosylrhamnosyl-N-acetylglucosaminyl-diphospho-decaprenol beta-1,5/1,6-galactofuranosyltransferase